MSSEQRKLVVYQSENDSAMVDVRLKDETVWLSQFWMTELFQKNKRTVSEHIRNVFKDGKSYQVNYYNLDVIISVGYRVKSRQGTQFRIWATLVLKDHLVKGCTFNPKRLAEIEIPAED